MIFSVIVIGRLTLPSASHQVHASHVANHLEVGIHLLIVHEAIRFRFTEGYLARKKCPAYGGGERSMSRARPSGHCDASCGACQHVERVDGIETALRL